MMLCGYNNRFACATKYATKYATTYLYIIYGSLCIYQDE